MVATAPAAAPGGDRWRASGWDYLVILGWLAVLTVLGLAVRRAFPHPGPIPPVAADAVAFGFSVLPVWAHLTVTEAGPRRGTWGKRRTGLAVVAGDGERAGAGRVAVRNAVKLLPWQLAHVSVARIIAGVDAPVTVATTYALSLVIPAVSIAIAWRDPAHRALHDLVAGTRVVRV
ncbi:RDD family protein [Modestobacter sp. SYSU DS0290]